MTDDIDLARPDPGASTSAQLRATQAALAASQADLTRVEKELHDALRRAADLEQVREELAQRKFRNEGDLADIQDLTRERDDARAEAKAALLALREMHAGHVTVVAEQDAGPCARCGLPIVRCQAVEALPDTTTKPQWAHVVCPTKEGP